MIDLHSHTTASDGSYSPIQLIDYAIAKKLTALAITDHDTIVGLASARRYLSENPGLAKQLILINGIEFSTTSPDYPFDIHIVGLNIDIANPGVVTQLNAILDSRNRRNQEMIRRLTQLGYDISAQELLAHCGDSICTRSHFANLLVKKGYFKNTAAAFEQLLANGKPGFVPRQKTDVADILNFIHSIGGFSILAHPTLYKLSFSGIYDLTTKLKSLGLDGIETYYSTYSAAEAKYLRQLADELNLLQSGGSDFHGSNKPDIDLGTGFGSLQIPDRLLSQFMPQP